MFHHPAWAVGTYSSGPPAGGTPQIQVNPTKVLDHQSHPVLTSCAPSDADDAVGNVDWRRSEVPGRQDDGQSAKGAVSADDGELGQVRGVVGLEKGRTQFF